RAARRRLGPGACPPGGHGRQVRAVLEPRRAAHAEGAPRGARLRPRTVARDGRRRGAGAAGTERRGCTGTHVAQGSPRIRVHMTLADRRMYTVQIALTVVTLRA